MFGSLTAPNGHAASVAHARAAGKRSVSGNLANILGRTVRWLGRSMIEVNELDGEPGIGRAVFVAQPKATKCIDIRLSSLQPACSKCAVI